MTKQGRQRGRTSKGAFASKGSATRPDATVVDWVAALEEAMAALGLSDVALENAAGVPNGTMGKLRQNVVQYDYVEKIVTYLESRAR